MPRSNFWLLPYAVLLTCVAAASNIDGAWPVDPRIDCSESTACSDVHLGRWDRQTCGVRIQVQQRKDPLFSEKYASNAEYFQQRPDGSLANTSDDMTLTLLGCETLCGSGTYYWDAIPRITTWLIPVVLLLCNIELCPIDKHRFMTVIHALGDPIDSTWSLLHKIYVWRRLHALATKRYDPRGEEEGPWSYRKRRWRRRLRRWCRWWLGFPRSCAHQFQDWEAALRRWDRPEMETQRQTRSGQQAVRPGQNGTGSNGDADAVDSQERDGLEDDEEFNTPRDCARVVATVLAGFEEISGAYITSEVQYTMVLDELGKIGRPGQSPGAWREWRHCARMLADARTNEFACTLLAIFVYIFGVVAALDDHIGGGDTTPPGGRIASAVFLLWLVPIALLSNIIGTFTSRRACLTIMRRFVRRAMAAAKSDDEAWRRDHSPPADRGSVSIPNPMAAPPLPGAFSSNARISSNLSSQMSLLGPDFWDYHLSTEPRTGSTSTTADGRPHVGESPGDGDVRLLIPITSWAEYFDSLHWLGAVYTYRPWKLGYRPIHGTSHRDYTPSWFLYLLALFPVLISAVGAFVILWYAVPVGWSCRHVWEVGLTVAWLLSSSFTTWLHCDKIPPKEAEDAPGLSYRNSCASQVGPAAAGDVQRTAVLDVVGTLDQRPSPGLSPGAPRVINTEGAAVQSPDDKEADLSSQSRVFPPEPDEHDDGGARAHPPSGTATSNTHPINHQPGKAVVMTRWTERRRWHIMLIKDAVVGLGGLAVIFLSTAGVFNNCWCWSAYMWHRWIPGDWGREAFVSLNSKKEYLERADHVYAPVVAACLAAQLLFVLGVVVFWWDGVGVVRWNETRRRREWCHEVVGEEEGEEAAAPAGEGLGSIKSDDGGYLLFWYSAAELAAQKRARHDRRTAFIRKRERLSRGECGRAAR